VTVLVINDFPEDGLQEEHHTITYAHETANFPNTPVRIFIGDRNDLTDP